MFIPFKDDIILTPKEFIRKSQEYLQDNTDVFAVAIEITNLKEIIDTFGYDIASSTLMLFKKLLYRNFKGAIIAAMFKGEYIIFTDKDASYINEFFKKLQERLEEYFNKGKLPILVEFHSGLVKADQNVKNSWRKATIAMNYKKCDTVYMRYYRPEMEQELSDCEKYIEQLDQLLKEKQVDYRLLDIIDVVTNNVMMKEVRLIDKHHHDIFDNCQYQIIQKYKRTNKIDDYNMDHVFREVIGKDDRIYAFNIDYNTIHQNQYRTLNKLKCCLNKYHCPPERLCLIIDYSKYHDDLLSLLYITREIKKTGVKLCLQRLGLMEQSYSSIISASLPVDFIKVNQRTLIKAMNEKRVHIMLEHFVAMYAELDIHLIFTDVSSQEQIDYIKALPGRCYIRLKQKEESIF